MADELRAIQLFADFVNGTLSDEGKKELDQHIREFPQAKELLEKEFRPEDVASYLDMLDRMDKEVMRERIWDHIQEQAQKRSSKLRWLWLGSGVAAAIFIAFLIGPKFWGKDKSPHNAQVSTIAPTTVPAQKRPTLKIGDRLLYLDSLPMEKRLALIGNLLILKRGDRFLEFRFIQDEESKSNTATIDINIDIPNDITGWQAILPDRSKSIIRPGTSITIPLLADGGPSKNRKIIAKGSAMLEISHDSKHPFRVSTFLGDIEVRGTLFEIELDSTRNTEKIALYTGQLKVNNGKQSLVLAPGQSAVLRRSGSAIDTVPLTQMIETIPWKDEPFDFSNQNLAVTMDRLKNYYDLDSVVIADNVDTVTPGKFSGGWFPKDLSLDEILDQVRLQKHDLQFMHKNRTLYVTAK